MALCNLFIETTVVEGDLSVVVIWEMVVELPKVPEVGDWFLLGDNQMSVQSVLWTLRERQYIVGFTEQTPYDSLNDMGTFHEAGLRVISVSGKGVFQDKILEMFG